MKAIANANAITGRAIFTDGSGFENNIGAVAAMFRNGQFEKSIKYHLGSMKNHTVYEAEALAVILALHLLTELNKVLTSVTIGLDNQAVLLGLQNQRSKPGHHLLDRIHDALQDFQVVQVRKRGERITGYRKGRGRAKLRDGSLGWKE